MSVAALDLNDASLTLVCGTDILAVEEGCAFAGPAGLVFGAAARERSKLSPLQFSQGYWRALSDAPLARPLPGYGNSIALARAHLLHIKSLLPAACEGVALATPPYWGADQLALLLGIAEECAVRVIAVVDGAVAAARRPHPGATLFQLEATLEDCWVSRISQDSGAALAGRERASEGVEALRRRAAAFFANCFLRTSRFDPSQDAGSEQHLYDRMRDWADRLADDPQITVDITHGGHVFTGIARAADLQAHMIAALEPLLRRLRALSGPGQSTVLQVPAHLGAIPGVLEALSAASPLDLVMLAPGEAARGALRARPSASPEGHRLVTGLPWDQPAIAPLRPPGARAERSAALVPTHVLHAGKAYRLGGTPFLIGLELADREFGLALPPGVRAVSRRHCTIKEESGRMVLHDHSRFGTALNGHRVDGSAILHAGDRVTLGQPPEEFLLIAEVAHRGP